MTIPLERLKVAFSNQQDLKRDTLQISKEASISLQERLYRLGLELPFLQEQGVGKLSDDTDLINAISGNSVGIGGSSIVGVSISKGVGADAPITVELATETATGTNVS